jgi:hypothetical protein
VTLSVVDALSSTDRDGVGYTQNTLSARIGRRFGTTF